ncbi:MAG: hypothetical protein ACD_12C00822G0001 [uncultured bacterium]|nr:MAG: hypothetical protein ACD_12C00822G0001 [uncultured bacterium]
MNYTDRLSLDGIGRTLAYERMFQMTFKEIAAVTALAALAIPIVQALLHGTGR